MRGVDFDRGCVTSYLWMAPLDPLTLAWVWFSELVRSQGSCHPNFLVIYGKRTHARVGLNVSIPTLDSVWCSSAMFVFQKKQVPGDLQPKPVFLAF